LAELVDPVVKGGPPNRLAATVLEQRSQHPVRGQTLDIEANRLFDDIVGELGARTGALASGGEAGIAGSTEKPL